MGVNIAQLVRALDCDPRGRGVGSRYSPNKNYMHMLGNYTENKDRFYGHNHTRAIFGPRMRINEEYPLITHKRGMKTGTIEKGNEVITSTSDVDPVIIVMIILVGAIWGFTQQDLMSKAEQMKVLAGMDEGIHNFHNQVHDI